MTQTCLLVVLVACFVTALHVDLTMGAAEESNATTSAYNETATDASTESTTETTTDGTVTETSTDADSATEASIDSNATESAAASNRNEAATTATTVTQGSTSSVATTEPSNTTDGPKSIAVKCAQCIQCETSNTTESCVSSNGFCLMSFHKDVMKTNRSCLASDWISCDKDTAYPNNGRLLNNVCGFCCMEDYCNNKTLDINSCKLIVPDKGGVDMPLASHLLTLLVTVMACVTPLTRH